MGDVWQPQKLNYSHKALADLIIARPAATHAELGAMFGRSKEWVTLIKSSGMFREHMALRMAEIADPVLTASLEERIELVTTRSFEILADKLSAPSKEVPDNLVLAAAALGAKAQGLGGFSSKAPPAPPPQDASRFERLAERLLNLGSPRPQEISDAQILSETRA